MKMRIIYPSLLVLSCFTACKSTKPKVEVEVKTPISYNKDIKPIVQNNCVSCHSGNTPAHQINLETYEQVRFQAEEGKLLKRINDAQHPMPINGLMPLNKRILIQDWADKGFKKE